MSSYSCSEIKKMQKNVFVVPTPGSRRGVYLAVCRVRDTELHEVGLGALVQLNALKCGLSLYLITFVFVFTCFMVIMPVSGFRAKSGKLAELSRENVLSGRSQSSGS